jgi:HSP20 family protein
VAEPEKTTAVATGGQRAPSLFEQMDRQLEAMRRQMTEVFGRPFGFPQAPSMPEGMTWAPSVDAFVADNTLVVKADLPGVKKEDVSVTVQGDVLTIAGQRTEEKETKEANYYAAERFRGAFARSFPLPKGVDTTAIAAEYTDGVLEVRVPLPAQAKAEPAKIEIKG